MAVAESINATNELAKTLLKTDQQFWIVVACLILTSLVCIFCLFISRRLKKLNEVHQECLDDREEHLSRLNHIEASHESLVETCDWLKNKFDTMMDKIMSEK